MNRNTFLLVSILVLGANAFLSSPTALHKHHNVYRSSTSDDADSEMFQGILNDADSSIMDQMDIMNELSWRFDRSKLEEQEQNRFRKRIQSKPWKLPYNDARKWVQANLGIETEDEYHDLVANGNLRTPYIPKNPEKYYSEDWISWNDFLKGDTQ